MRERMNSFRTSDGMDLAYWEVGRGPVVVLVHGTAVDHRCFDPILGYLSEFTIVSYDRRGHGQSGDPPGYSLEREVHDLVELIAHVAQGRVSVIGYSYGGVITLRAITTTPAPVAAAVLYEPPMGQIVSNAEHIEALLSERRFEEALRTFVSTTFYLPDTVVAAMTSDPMWSESIGLVDNLRRELPAVRAAIVTPAPAVVAPTRVLVAASGGNPEFHRIASRIEASLEQCDVVSVPGVPHLAMGTEPSAFAQACREHLQRHGA